MEERLGSYFEPLGPAGKMLESLKAGCQKAMPAHTPGTEPSGSAVGGDCFFSVCEASVCSVAKNTTPF
jgi:hypothetical protein